jgi:peptide/nickel transport system permease protein
LSIRNDWLGWLCLTLVVYALNMFGDALRDLLDPRLRGGEGGYGTAVVKRKKGFLSRLINIRANHYELTN